MSHVTIKEGNKRDEQILDINALAAAAVRCGLVFKANQTTFHNWATDHGRLAGDYPLPEGFKTIEELQASVKHAISLPEKERTGGTNNYEIGVVASRKFPGTFSLAYDFYGGKIDQKAGKQLDKLRMFYQMGAAKNKAKTLGYRYTETLEKDNSYTVKLDVSSALA